MLGLLFVWLSCAAGSPGPGPWITPVLTCEVQDDQIDRLLRAATSGRQMIRGQAAGRLVRLYEGSDEEDQRRIVERLHKAVGEDLDSLAATGNHLIEILGVFDDKRLRDRLWQAVRDPDFPWRPAAVRAVALTQPAAPDPEEVQRFHALVTDPLAAVRVAAAQGAAAIMDSETKELLRTRLLDEDDQVRRTVASLLASHGEPAALWWILEDLLRTDMFFDLPTGEQARFQAWSMLAPHLSEEVKAAAQYRPSLAPDSPEGAAALAILRQALTDSPAGVRPEFPRRIEAAGDLPAAPLGLEIRSCRRGEFFLRWTVEGELLVGRGNPARVPMGRDLIDELLGTTEAASQKLEGAVLFGEPGCDMEQFLWNPPDSPRLQRWVIAKGPEAQEGLRPEALSGLGRELLASLPDRDSTDPRLKNLRTRVKQALESVGGSLPENN